MRSRSLLKLLESLPLSPSALIGGIGLPDRFYHFNQNSRNAIALHMCNGEAPSAVIHRLCQLRNVTDLKQ